MKNDFGKLTRNSSRGQGATEYLVILGIVLFIALLVILILGFFPITAQDISMTESQVYWQGQAKPVRINAAAAGNGTFCARPGWGHVFSIENTNVDPLNVTGINIDGIDKLFCVYGGSSLNNVEMGGLEKNKIEIFISDDSICKEGQLISVELYFNYETEYLSNQVEHGTKKLAMRCSSDITG